MAKRSAAMLSLGQGAGFSPQHAGAFGLGMPARFATSAVPFRIPAVRPTQPKK